MRFRRVMISLAALCVVPLLAGIGIDWHHGDTRMAAGGWTMRHWALVPEVVFLKPACAAGLIKSGRGPCGGTTGGATSYTMTGPATGNINDTLIYTDQANGPTTVTATPNDGGHDGVFSPTSITLSPSTVTFTYAPLQISTWNISSGNSGSLVDPTPISFTTNTNLLTGYPTFSTGAWQTGDLTFTATGSTDPFGGTNGSTITEDTLAAYHDLYFQPTLTASQVYTASVFVKPGSGTRNLDVVLQDIVTFANSITGIFNPSSCTVSGSQTGGAGVMTSGYPKVRQVGTWCLVQIKGSIGANTAAQLGFYMDDNSNPGNANYTGDGTSSLLIYGGSLQ